MRLLAPSYYTAFACIAEHCQSSCCIGWQIGVDDGALARFRTLPTAEAQAILATVHTDEDSGERVFRQKADGRCPHLTEAGLCRIIERHGDGFLCDICREHPRFYHTTARGEEAGLGLACEEACRLILTSDGYTDMTDIGSRQADEPPPTFDTVAERERLYAVLSDRTVPYSARLSSLWARAAMTAPPSEEDGRALLCSLEYLNEENLTRFAAYTQTPRVPDEDDVYLERFLAYLILRHVSPTTSAEALRYALRMCLFCERLYASLLGTGADAFEAARTISEEIEYSEDNTEELLLASAFF